MAVKIDVSGSALPRLFSVCFSFALMACGSSSGTSGGSDAGTAGTSAGTDSTTTTADTTSPSGDATQDPAGSGTASASDSDSTDSTTADPTEGPSTDTDTAGPEPFCGDGSVDIGESCDDANDVNDDACKNDCSVAVCGDGVVQVGVDECDDGNDVPNDGCTNECKLPACGDGLVQPGEECDAGGENGPGKACKADCTKNVCGDGDQGPGEGCDDGNQVDDDACTNMCTLASCGDGVLQDGEACDDGNDSNEDMCTNACTLAACGDSFTQPPEECDNGPDNSDSAACTSSCVAATCGDGLIWAGMEECDDGENNGPMQNCLADCVENVCGDGDQGPNEGCDDGNLESGDGCNLLCNPELLCDGKLYECGNGFDDDMDGKIDLEDPECISPCDDDESSFQTDLPGQNNDCKADCYFDSNSGQGDDKCVWNLKCDPLNPGADVGCPYDPNQMMCDVMMPQTCLDFCVPLVPNGCDCFGCCQVGDKFYYLDSNPQCSLDNLEACNECTFFENCNNPCVPEDCELCFGQDPDDLPEECGGQPSCDEGIMPCLDTSECQVGEFCQTGCCVPISPQ